MATSCWLRLTAKIHKFPSVCKSPRVWTWGVGYRALELPFLLPLCAVSERLHSDPA